MAKLKAMAWGVVGVVLALVLWHGYIDHKDFHAIVNAVEPLAVRGLHRVFLDEFRRRLAAEGARKNRRHVVQDLFGLWTFEGDEMKQLPARRTPEAGVDAHCS